MKEKTAELKPCPFCGGEVVLLQIQHKDLNNRKHFFACKDCGTSVFLEGKGKYKSAEQTEIEASTLWNKRADKSDNKQLTFEQLKQRVGKPAYEAEYKMWGIIDFDDQYPNSLYFCTEKNGVRFCWDIKRLKLYNTEVEQ